MEDELIKAAELGDEARKFIDSDIGRAMLDKADEELRRAQEALETVDPENPKAIRDLQNQAQRARNFGEWLKSLVDDGDNALTVWRETNAES